MEKKIYSVKELNQELKKITTTFFSNIFLEGEISSIKFHNTGNIYLDLKDDEALINAVTFKNNFKNEFKVLKEGTKVTVKGNLSVYVRGGRYSFNIVDLKIQGKGELYEQFLILKEKLSKEGLFSLEKKKQLPIFPKKIGVITAPEGAAIKDILTVSKKRFSSTDITIIPTKVQGDNAAESIINSIDLAHKIENIELLIVGRGGGSYDDLFVFNDEKLAYKVFNSKIPIISAVGHEQDVTIIDFVADIRAATPSHKAEFALPSKKNIQTNINQYYKIISNIVNSKLQYFNLLIEKYDDKNLTNIINDKVINFYRDLDFYKEKLDKCIENQISNGRNKLSILYNSLEKLNPLYILNKNYSITYNKHNDLIKSINEVNIGDEIKIRLKDGFINSKVENKINL